MSEHMLAPILCLPAAGLAEAEEQLRTGLTTNGGGGAPVSALRILNLFLQRLGCDFQVGVARIESGLQAGTQHPDEPRGIRTDDRQWSMERASWHVQPY